LGTDAGGVVLRVIKVAIGVAGRGEVNVVHQRSLGSAVVADEYVVAAMLCIESGIGAHECVVVACVANRSCGGSNVDVIIALSPLVALVANRHLVIAGKDSRSIPHGNITASVLPAKKADGNIGKVAGCSQHGVLADPIIARTID